MKLLRQLLLILSISLFSVVGIAQEEDVFLHTVKTGETLYSIAHMYNVNVSQITKLNPGSADLIYIGELLRIPQQKANAGVLVFHTIKNGETLYKLSQTYKVSVKEICDYNPGLNTDNFKSGEVIRIPAPKKEEGKQTVDGVNVTVATSQDQAKVTQEPVARYKEMHKVKRKETVYSICKKYKISEEELVAANPSIKTAGLQKGDMLYIPYPAPEKPAPKTPTDKELFDSYKTSRAVNGAIKVAIMLPFEQDNRMVEYYEGLLLAVDSLKHTGVSMDVYAYDTSTKDINELLKENKEMADMDIIFGPKENENTKIMADFARKHQIKLVIPFNSKDNEVFSNPYIYMVNTPQTFLYSTVYDHFSKQFNNPNVIFLENTVGDKTKEEFIKGFKDYLLRNGVTYTSLSDESTVESMSESLFNGRTNIFIPTSGTHVELIKILTNMELLKRKNRSMNICMFGYPEWQTVTKEHLKQFFAINTYFYSSFYTNDILPEAKRFEREYNTTYHKMMEYRYPKYGMLGYDTGFYFLRGLSTCNTRFNEDVNNLPIKSVQTGFLMKRVNNWGGFINKKIYFIHYTSNSEVVKNDFDWK